MVKTAKGSCGISEDGGVSGFEVDDFRGQGVGFLRRVSGFRASGLGFGSGRLGGRLRWSCFWWFEVVFSFFF